MVEKENKVVIKKGDEEYIFYGNTLSQITSGGELQFDLFRVNRKPNFTIIIILIAVYILALSILPSNIQTLKFLIGAVLSTCLAVYLYIIYDKKTLLVVIIAIGILLSMTSSDLLDYDSFKKIIVNLFK